MTTKPALILIIFLVSNGVIQSLNSLLFNTNQKRELSLSEKVELLRKMVRMINDMACSSCTDCREDDKEGEKSTTSGDEKDQRIHKLLSIRKIVETVKSLPCTKSVETGDLQRPKISSAVTTQYRITIHERKGDAENKKLLNNLESLRHTVQVLDNLPCAQEGNTLGGLEKRLNAIRAYYSPTGRVASTVEPEGDFFKETYQELSGLPRELEPFRKIASVIDLLPCATAKTTGNQLIDDLYCTEDLLKRLE